MSRFQIVIAFLETPSQFYNTSGCQSQLVWFFFINSWLTPPGHGFPWWGFQKGRHNSESYEHSEVWLILSGRNWQNEKTSSNIFEPHIFCKSWFHDDNKKYEVYKILDAPFHRLDHKAAWCRSPIHPQGERGLWHQQGAVHFGGLLFWAWAWWVLVWSVYPTASQHLVIAIAPSFCADGFASNGLICPAQVDFGCFDFIGH